MYKGPKELASVFSSELQFSDEHQKSYAIENLKNYFARSDSIVKYSIKFLIESLKKISQETLKSRRIVILTTEDDEFSNGDILAHSGNNSIYVHINTIIALSQLAVYNKDLAEEILLSIFEHEDRDLQRGYHKDDIPKEKWEKVKEFWDIIREKRIYSDKRIEYLNLIRKTVNPKGDKKTALYIGGGGDISTALLSTDAEKFIFVDALNFENIEEPKSYELKDYIIEKYIRGFSFELVLLFVTKGAKPAILYELKILGCEIESIQKVNENEHRIVFLTKDGKKKEILYYQIGNIEDSKSYEIIKKQLAMVLTFV